MPRLFTSHRPTAPQLVPVAARPRIHTESADIAMPSPSPPPVQPVPLPKMVSCSELLKQKPDLPQSELTALVLVPPVPKYILKLMDSHDIDNPYLMAAFNVLIENNNNPMRVPDILQAVSTKGWTQVLHKHKDRPEQLFGNALRSHQRRRENLGLPSLVFMIDAGACWKHHELDLSAASGRKKGKIWCFSTDAGFPCPYTRLGLDLETVRQCQHAPGEEGSITTATVTPAAKKAARPRGDSDAEDDEDPSGTSSSRPVPSKKRKIVTTTAAAAPLTQILSSPERFETTTTHSDNILSSAVRGNVTSAHTVASSLQPPPYVPAAPIIIPPTTTPHTNTPTPKIRITTGKAAGRPISTLARTRGQTRRQLDLGGLDGLEAMSPDPETGYEAEAEVEAGDDEELGFTNKYGATVPFSNLGGEVESDQGRSLSLALEMAYISQSDDDDDDFHVTMQEFSDDEEMMAPIKQEEDDLIPPSFLLSMPSPYDDFDSSDGASIIRTPTPNLQQAAPTTSLIVDQSTWENFEAEGPFHGYGLGIQDIPNWDTEQISVLKDEMVNQGWSRAPSPEFHQEQASRLMRASPLRLDMMNLDSAPHSPADCLGLDGGYPGSSRSSISAASSCGSLAFSTLPHTPMTEAMDPMSRRGSVFGSPASFSSPHPLILYSPCLSPTVDPERPLKCGLAHRYLYPPGEAPGEAAINPQKVQELEESLVNFDETEEGESMIPSVGFKQLPWPPSPLSLQPMASPSPIPDFMW